MNIPMIVSRLQLGTSRLEKLSPPARMAFVDKSWIHLGDQPQPFLRRVGRILLAGDALFTRTMYRNTDFREFFSHSGDRLLFESGSFTFIYSEHFFEHLPSCVALDLFRECYRLLKIGGVLRTVVPDAVFRTYEPPEPVGYPTRLPAGHPQKHRVRFTLELLSNALKECGFRAIPLDYCTVERTHIQRAPASIRNEYYQNVDCADWPIVADTSYIMRTPSLIVDAMKER
jgi:predicted SAM-dependent methyltransferase